MADAQFCFLMIDHWSTCMTKSEWASWAQAIGTIIAVAISIGLAWWTSEKQDRRVRAAFRQAREALRRSCLATSKQCLEHGEMELTALTKLTCRPSLR